MVDENVWYVPVPVPAPAVLVPVKMVRAGSFVEMVGTDWPWTVLRPRKRTARKAPKRLEGPIVRRRSTASQKAKKQHLGLRWDVFGMKAIVEG
jgi:hypothetical protein